MHSTDSYQQRPTVTPRALTEEGQARTLTHGTSHLEFQSITPLIEFSLPLLNNLKAAMRILKKVLELHGTTEAEHQ